MKVVVLTLQSFLGEESLRDKFKSRDMRGSE